MKISDQFAQKRLNLLMKVVQKTLGYEQKLAAEVTILDKNEMTELNSFYRRKKSPTDVLSFEAPEPFRSYGLMGELLICGDVLEKQAKAMKHSSQKELDILLVHGVLHLMGYDHEKSKREAQMMADLEQKVLVNLKQKSAKGLIERVAPQRVAKAKPARVSKKKTSRRK